MSKCRLRPFLLATAVSALLGLGPNTAFAETLSDALVKAYQTSPFLQSSRAALRAQDEAVPQASSAKKPQASLDGNANLQTDSDQDDDDDVRDFYEVGLNASLLLYDHGQTKAAIDSARLTVAAGRADLRDVEQQVLFSAVTAFMDVRQGLEFVAIAENDVSLLEEQLRAANNRFDVGEVTRTDVSLTEAQLEASRATLEDARGNLAIARAAYLSAVGTPPGDLSAPPPLPALPATVKESEAIGLRTNPLILSAQFSEQAAVADFDRALAAKGPNLSLGGFAGYQGNERIGTGDKLAATIGLEGSLPLTTGGNLDSLVRQAQQILEQRQSQVQEAGRSVIESVNNAWIQLMVARATIIANQRQLEAATIAFEGVSEEARLGARSTIDVLDANQDRLEAAAEVVRSKRNEYVAGYAVLQSIGLLTVKHLRLGVEVYDPDIYFTEVRNGPRGGYDTSAVDRIRARWEQN